MHIVEEASLSFLSAFYQKLVDDGKPVEWVRKVQLFPDRGLLRQQRNGFFGWIRVGDYYFARSIDWLIAEEPQDYKTQDAAYKNVDKHYKKLLEMFANYDKYDLPLKEPNAEA